MSPSREPREHVIHFIRLYHRGIIGPSEMWMSIAGVLTPATAAAVLDALPQDVKGLLHAVWLERPPAAYIHRSDLEPGDEAFQSTCARVVRWCEASGPRADVPAEPDWMIKVRAAGDHVTEWRPWEGGGAATPGT